VTGGVPVEDAIEDETRQVAGARGRLHPPLRRRRRDLDRVQGLSRGGRRHRGTRRRNPRRVRRGGDPTAARGRRTIPRGRWMERFWRS
jgi:hypothetical protein